MKLATKNVTTEEAKKVEGYVRLCMRTLKKKKYELDLPNGAIDKAVEVLEVKKTKTAQGGCGGAHLIRINITHWQNGRPMWKEYDAFNDDPVIGKKEVWDNDDHLLILIAHEVAHHVQFRYAPRVPRFKSTYRKPHGDCFQTIYRYLRKDLVNPMIEEKLNSRKIGLGVRIAA